MKPVSNSSSGLAPTISKAQWHTFSEESFDPLIFGFPFKRL